MTLDVPTKHLANEHNNFNILNRIPIQRRPHTAFSGSICTTNSFGCFSPDSTSKDATAEVHQQEISGWYPAVNIEKTILIKRVGNNVLIHCDAMKHVPRSDAPEHQEHITCSCLIKTFLSMHTDQSGDKICLQLGSWEVPKSQADPVTDLLVTFHSL
jgi:hypothetical protein